MQRGNLDDGPSGARGLLQEQVRSLTPDLQKQIERALGGEDRFLIDALCRGSRLPGTRPDLDFATSFAKTCASMAKANAKIPKLVTRLVLLDADVAPGGTALEFVPLAGVLAAGAVAVVRERNSMLALLHDAAEDLRFRVRDAVPDALATIGAREGDVLLADLESWMDGYFHAAAVLFAITRPGFLSALRSHELATKPITLTLHLLNDAPRTASRYPGYKAALDALLAAPEPLAMRFGGVVLDALDVWASFRDPGLRDALATIIRSKRLRSRLPDETRRLAQALEKTTPLPRDPRTNVGPTRRRGKKR